MSERTKSRRLLSAIEAVRTGGLSLRREIAAAEAYQPRERCETTAPEAYYSRFLPDRVGTVKENLDENPDFLKECFWATVIDVADAYDSLDHYYSPLSGRLMTDLQDDCQAVREFVRSRHPVEQDTPSQL